MKLTKKELKGLIFECLVEHYIKVGNKLMEDQEKDGDMVYGEGEELPDATDQILAKFPTLKHCLIRLHTDQYRDFVSGIEWISPKPSGFRINLANGQDYTLKWMGKDFEITVGGKTYYLGELVNFQRALEKLNILYMEGPMNSSEEGVEGGEADFGGGNTGGGGGDFPGGDSGPEDEGGEEPEGGDEEGEDLGDEEVNFEADADI